MHPSIRPYLEYFSLPKGYGPAGLRWSANGEALETDDGTHRFTRQVADFIDGFAAVAPVPHFAHMLEFLELLSVRPPAACPDPERFKIVAAAFRQLGSPMRNAGVLFAHLYLHTGIPPAEHVPPGGGKSLAHWLTHSPSLGFLHPTGPGNPEMPALAVHAFHERIAARLRAMTDFEVRHWLRHGIAPQDLPAEQIAEQLERKPPNMAEFLDAAVANRSRLGGAVPLVRQFVSALTLPPRKQSPPLPIGGYADVTNRGDPTRLLPSQFALDADEFVRRFAENELLFFRREDPHERRRDQLSLVVDQGVLTWGTVRHALGAAVLAFGKLAARRQLPFTVRFSSSPAMRFAPPLGDAKHFGETLEASCLSSHAGQALAEEVFDPNAKTRDVVVLTHPRTLRETEIQRLTKLMPDDCRLFALTATEEGEVELLHLRGGGIVPISRFRVDFKTLAPQLTLRAAPTPLYTPWSGDVEPIPFPFRFGLTNRVVDLAFDAGGARLMAATVGGFLYAWTLADGSMEVVPRGGHEGQVIKDVQAVLGVENGFVICGRLESSLAAVHYDWSTRTAMQHTLFSDALDVETAWHAFPHMHSICVKAGPVYRAVDLGTGGRYPEPISARSISARAQAAADAARNLQLPLPHVPVIKSEFSQTPSIPYVVHDSATGRMRVIRPISPIAFTPTTDGRPRLKGPSIISAQLAGQTLALTAHATYPVWSLHDMENDGATLVELPRPHAAHIAKLSPDGRLFARQTDTCELTITDPLAATTVLTTLPGRCHSNLDVRLGYRCLGIGIGSRGCLLDWNAGALVVREGLSPADDFGKRATNKLYRSNGIFAPTTGRFVGTYRFTRWEVGLDGFGQIAFYREGVVACMFLYRRGKLAAWTPDGVRLGPAELTGGPETPGALERLGETLRQVTR
jgi:hypothetical protein